VNGHGFGPLALATIALPQRVPDDVRLLGQIRRDRLELRRGQYSAPGSTVERPAVQVGRLTTASVLDMKVVGSRPWIVRVDGHTALHAGATCVEHLPDTHRDWHVAVGRALDQQPKDFAELFVWGSREGAPGFIPV
jgi:hypothetical protein